MLVHRAASRRTFGKRVLEHQVVQHQIAEIRISIDQCRLLTLNAAHLIDKYGGAKKARKEVNFHVFISIYYILVTQCTWCKKKINTSKHKDVKVTMIVAAN